MPATILEHIDTLATFDEQRTRLKDAWVLVRDNRIEALDPAGSEPQEADQRIDMPGHGVLPGLISTHHHYFQTLLRNLPGMQQASLFPWLNDLYLLMSEVADEDQYVATLVAHAELLLSGCTTTVTLLVFCSEDEQAPFFLSMSHGLTANQSRGQ
jgi:8-oxoguanine deaminase